MANGGRKFKARRPQTRVLASSYMPQTFTDQIRATVQKQLARFGIVDEETAAIAQRRDAISSARVSAGLSGIGAARGYKQNSYSSLARNLGKRVVAMGENVPEEIRRVAYDAANGKGTLTNEEVLRVLRDYRGIARSGAGVITSAARTVQRNVRNAARLGIMIDLAQRGGATGAMAQADLLNQGTELISSAATNKTVQRIAERVVSSVGANPNIASKLLFALGRAARVGGAVAGAVQLGFAAAQAFQESRAVGYRAQVGVSTHAWNMRLTPGVGVGVRAEASRQTGHEYGMMGSVRNWLSGTRSDWLDASGAMNERQGSLVEQRLKQMESMRGLSANIIPGVQNVLASYAAGKGKSVDELTDIERADALDPLLNDQRKKWMWSEGANNYVASQRGKLTWYERQAEKASINTAFSHEEQWRQEWVENQIKSEVQKVADRSFRVSKYLSHLTIDEKYRRDMWMREGIYKREATRHRFHAAAPID